MRARYCTSCIVIVSYKCSLILSFTFGQRRISRSPSSAIEWMVAEILADSSTHTIGKKKQKKKKHVTKKYCGDTEVRVSRMISLIHDARTVRRNAAVAFGTKPRFSTGRFRIVSVVDEYGFDRPTYRTAHAHSRTTTTPTLQY